MNDNLDEQIVTAKLVSDGARLNFLPSHFGRHFMRGEAMVYDWAGRLNAQYRGGFWQFFDLSNGGFYLAPVGEQVNVEWHLNGFGAEMSSDAFGIVVTLFTLCHLAELTEDDNIGERYHLLRDFVTSHAEAATIWRAID